MAVFNNMLVTNKGKVMYANVMAGSTINFTRVAFGSGSPASSAETLEALVNQEIEGSIGNVEVTENGAIFTAEVNNSNLATAIGIKEIGIFAKVTTGGVEGEEQMYAYCYSTNDIDVIPANGSATVNWKIRLQLDITNATVTETEQTDLLTYSPDLSVQVLDGKTYISNLTKSCKYIKKGGSVNAFYEFSGNLTNMSTAETGLKSVTISLPETAKQKTTAIGRLTIPYSRTVSGVVYNDYIVISVPVVIEGNTMSIDYLGLQDGAFTLSIAVTYLI